MRVLFDARVLSTGAADRGMGRFSLQLLDRMVRHHEVHLQVWPDARLDLLDTRTSGNITNIESIDLPPEDASWSLTQEVTMAVEGILRRREYDVFFEPTPFVGPTHLDIVGARTAAVLYDLIPLHNADEYLPGPIQRSQYALAARFVRRAARVVAISRTVAEDGRLKFGLDPERIQVVYPTLARGFTDIASTKAEASRRGDFALLISGTHHSKGLRPFLQALQLARSKGWDTPVRIVLPTQFALNEWKSWPDALTRNASVLVDIPEEQKVSLLSQCAFFVHPSLEEGFGIPMAEAMWMGTPTLASRSRLAMEVGADSVGFYEPMDVHSACDALTSMSSDTSVTVKRGHSARERIHALYADASEAELLAYSDLQNTERTTNQRRRVAVVGPFPPRHCGIADYCEDVARGLSQKADVTAFSCDPDDVVPDLVDTDGIAIRPLAEFDEHDFDEVYVQLGMASWFWPLLEALVQGRFRSSTVVLHDLNMTVGMVDVWREQMPERSVIADMFMSELGGPQTPLLAQGLMLQGTPESRDLLARLPTVRWVVERAGALFRHVQVTDLEEVEGVDLGELVNMVTADPVQTLSVMARGDGFGRRASKTELRLGVYGNVVPNKRIESVLTATSILANLGLNVQLAVVGSLPDPAYSQKVRSLAQDLGLDGQVRFMGRLSTADVVDEALTWDVAVALRDPVAMGMSAALIRLMALGRPVLVSDVAEWRHLSDSGIVRVPMSENAHVEASLVALAILRLATGSTFQTRGHHARMQYELLHDPSCFGQLADANSAERQ